MMVRWYQCCVFPPLSLPSFCINVAPAGGFESPRVFSAEIHSFVVSLASLGVCLLSDAMKKKEAERRFQHRRKCKQNRIREKWDWASEYMKKKSVSFDYISFFFTWVERSEIPRGVNKYVSICLKFSTRCSQRERRKTVSAKNERESEAKYKKKKKEVVIMSAPPNNCAGWIKATTGEETRLATYAVGFIQRIFSLWRKRNQLHTLWVPLCENGTSSLAYRHTHTYKQYRVYAHERDGNYEGSFTCKLHFNGQTCISKAVQRRPFIGGITSQLNELTLQVH